MPQPILVPSQTGSLRIWDHPKDGELYVVGADVAEGRRRDRTALQRKTNINYGNSRPDYSAASVIEMVSGLHVASWHGYIPPDEYASVLAAIGWHYNQALMVVELNGPGVAVVSRLVETLKYDNMYVGRIWNAIDQDPNTKQFGWQTTTQSRKQLMMHLHAAINSGMLCTRDADLISEIRTMEFDDQGVERGRGNNKDDRPLSLALALEGRYSCGHLIGEHHQPGPRPAARAYEDSVWQAVQQKQVRNHGASHRRDPLWRSAVRRRRAR